MAESGERQRALGAALAWAGQPATLAALAVLLANDRVGKERWPGPVTGKLSDVAGLLVLPPLLTVLLTGAARLRRADRAALLALGLTGLCFLLVKSTTLGATVASALGTALAGPGRVLADPTDLAALPALGLAWWGWKRARRRPVGPAGVRRAGALAATALAAWATVATSAGATPPRYTVGTVDGVVRVEVTGGSHYWTGRYFGTADGAATWTEAPRTTGPGLTVRQSACVPGQPAHCYRVGDPGAPQVRESVDGGRTWRIAWRLSAGRSEFLKRVGANDWSGRPVRFSSDSVAVAASGAGFTVVVGDQYDGLLVRHGDGSWERTALLADPDFPQPAPLTGPGAPLAGEWLVAFGACLVAVRAGLDALVSRRRAVVGGVVAARSLAGLGLLTGFELLSQPVEPDLLGLPGPTLMLAVLLSSVLLPGPWRIPGGLPGDRALLLAAGGLVTGCLVLWPYYAWAAGSPDSFMAAVALSGAGLLAGCAGLGLVAALTRPTRSPRH